MKEQKAVAVRIEATPLEVIEAPLSAEDWLSLASAALGLAAAIVGAS